MGRWEPDARGRLERAAMELYVGQGYDRTTVAEIAERAGLTERTFFRHFADKREVLFRGSADLQDLVVVAVLAAPASASALDAVVAGVEAAAVELGGSQERARQRLGLVTAHPELLEREQAKMSALGTALTAALRQRGVADLAASLAAQAGVAIFQVGYQQWVADGDGRAYLEHVQDALAELRVLAAG